MNSLQDYTFSTENSTNSSKIQAIYTFIQAHEKIYTNMDFP